MMRFFLKITAFSSSLLVVKSLVSIEPTYWDGGRTYTLYVSPDGSSIENGSASWRVSVARLEAAESVFKGRPYDRMTVVAQGVGFLVIGKGFDQTMTRGHIYYYSGARELKCTRLGTLLCTDVNLFYQIKVHDPRTHLYKAMRVEERFALDYRPNEIMIVVCLEGRGTIALGTSDPKLMFEYDSVKLDPPLPSDIVLKGMSPGSRFVVIRLGPTVS